MRRDALYLLAATLLDAEDRRLGEIPRCWKAKADHDGKEHVGWFWAGITDPRVGPVSYHLPVAVWEHTPGTVCEKAPAYDGCTAKQMAERVQSLAIILQSVPTVNT